MAQGASLSIFSEVDEYGFERPEDFDYKSYEEFMSSYINVLARRSKKWSELLGNRNIIQKNAKLKRYIRKGIPAEYRGLVWFAVSGAEELKNNMSDNFYKSLLKQDLNPGIVDVIKLDLHRTFPNNIFFKNAEHCQTELFNVLVAYAHHNPKVGYCQGLNYIAGLLLLVTKNEETAFWLLKILIEHILEDYYSNTMEGLIIDIEVLSQLIKSSRQRRMTYKIFLAVIQSAMLTNDSVKADTNKCLAYVISQLVKVPDVYQHVTNLGLPWAVICTKWFVCLFAEVLPIETVLRIWDCLFYEGSKIFFRVGITLMKLDREHLLRCKDYAEAVTRFKTITKDKTVVNCHSFMQSIFKVPGSLSNSTILKLREKVAAERKDYKKS